MLRLHTKEYPVTFRIFDPDQYREWLTTSQAAADLAVEPADLDNDVVNKVDWTSNLVYINTRLGRLYDPTSLDAAFIARHRKPREDA